jgi:tRNA1(Val) A37 N6-methylase TrmN6
MRLGYFPLHQREAQRMRRFLQFPNEPGSALDPCAGTGAALAAITENSGSRRYGIELDSHRALEARTTLDEVIQGNAFDAKAPVESVSLLYLNPPYDFEVGEAKSADGEAVSGRVLPLAQARRCTRVGDPVRPHL